MKRTFWIRVPGFSFRWDRPAKECMKPEYRQTVILSLIAVVAFLGFIGILFC